MMFTLHYYYYYYYYYYFYYLLHAMSVNFPYVHGDKSVFSGPFRLP